ncbi:MAG: hypothetical protein IJV07_01170 [Alphaproteobacteria bacterium]|nr:hypothetical protein [Alphaproteobacteria bacterium]
MSQKQIRYINTQSGRSMVEMLGTLAIMGVLTIGGIAGYRYAINKSNANTILNAVSQMAVTASTELTTQGSLTLPEWKDANGNLSISGAFGVETAQNNDGTFSIIISDMNDEVCERIKGMDWKVPEDVAINGESDSCDQGEANKIAFVFSNTLTKKSATNGTGGESGEDTGNDEPETPVCPANFDTHDGCQSCKNGVITYSNEGSSCVGVDGSSVCDGTGKCCSPDGNEGQKCCELLEMHWAGGNIGCCESIGNWNYSGNFCCADGTIMGTECCTTILNQKCCNDAGYRWDDENEFCCASNVWDYSKFDQCFNL